MKYEVVSRTGTKIGNGFLAKEYLSIQCRLDDGKRKQYKTRNNGHTPYMTTYGWYASHYKSGMSKATKAAYDQAKSELQIECDRLNAEG
jgi:hypothetical protein